MGRLDNLRGRRVYLDSNVFIYALEALPKWGEAAASVLRMTDSGEMTGVTSELTLAECLSKPFAGGQHENVRVFEEAICTRGNLLVPAITREILIEAARIRTPVGLKLPDAIHVATAVRSGCQFFLTNDQRLRSNQVIEVVLLSSVASD